MLLLLLVLLPLRVVLVTVVHGRLAQSNDGKSDVTVRFNLNGKPRASLRSAVKSKLVVELKFKPVV